MVILPPVTYPAARRIQFEDVPPVVIDAWNRTRITLSEIAERLDSGGLSATVKSVFLAGSLGRMEQLSQSDADVIVIVEDDVDPESRFGRDAFDSVWDALEELGLARPKSDGVFAMADKSARLCDPTTRGLINEDMGVFGRRFQMLLDSQPVYGVEEFERLQGAVLDRYASDFLDRDANKQWTYLLNDLIRYFRSLCVRTQWISEVGPWRLINTKLRHSRVLNYAGLLLLLGECSTRHDKVDWLKSRMKWTPLERVAAVFATHHDERRFAVADAYGRFLESMHDAEFVTGLCDDAVATDRWDSPQLEHLKSTSDEILRNLLGFVLDRRDDWHPRFFEYLLF
ncbi:MAG: DUF294 nucleotidyltransferase-like domain-containing protein [Planctomycetota bacterium]|nr:DUF294 nucleotidyltransferase-like domain-containing protein [Planctomycetota bacterium]